MTIIHLHIVVLITPGTDPGGRGWMGVDHERLLANFESLVTAVQVASTPFTDT